MHLIGTDGSYRRTTGKASWSVVYQDQVKAELVKNFRISGITDNCEIIYTDEPCPGTNNRGELLAILIGLQTIIHLGIPDEEKKVIVSDSEYSIKSITEWYHNWVAKNLLAEKKNIDILSVIMEKKELIKNLTFKHVKSHLKPSEYMGKDIEPYCIINNTADLAAEKITI